MPSRGDVVAKVDQSQKWVEDIPQRKAKGEQRSRELQRNAELNKSREISAALKAYERRLNDFRDSRPPVAKRRKVDPEQSVTLKTGKCPDCETSLEYCRRCRILSCPRKDCAGQGPDLLRRCKNESHAHHAHEIYCAKCRESQAQDDPTKLLLTTCPVCHKDMCSQSLRFCDGKEGGDKTLHGVRAVCCLSCERKPTAELSHTVYSCINPACRTRCVCGDCAAARGRICEEHPAEWWCNRGGCADSPNCLCPTCGSLLCPDIICQSCEVCNKPSSCALCIALQSHRDAATHGSEVTEKVKDTPEAGSSKSPLSLKVAPLNNMLKPNQKPWWNLSRSAVMAVGRNRVSVRDIRRTQNSRTANGAAGRHVTCVEIRVSTSALNVTTLFKSIMGKHIGTMRTLIRWAEIGSAMLILIQSCSWKFQALDLGVACCLARIHVWAPRLSNFYWYTDQQLVKLTFSSFCDMTINTKMGIEQFFPLPN